MDFAALFQQSPARLLVVTPGAPFQIAAASDDYLAATLTTREILGREMFNVFPDNPGDPHATGVANLTASLERALATRAVDVMPVQKYDIRDKSGQFVERYWTPINTTVIGNDGTRVALIHRVEDVTPFVREGQVLRGEAAALRHEILLRARDLAAANGALRDSVELRRRLVAIVGHDLRTPLSTIRTGVHVLKAHFTKFGGAPPRMFDLVESAAGTIERLLKDLDDYTVSQLRGLLPVSRSWLNLREVCEGVVHATQVANPGRVVELEPGDNLRAYVDPERKRQVLTNLIDNALSHGAADRPVRVAARRGTGGCLMIVSNEGDPIPKDLVPKLFEPFRRGPGTGTREQRGHLGLGLFIVQQIVRAHQGNIAVESGPHGTSFIVFVPDPEPGNGHDTQPAQP